MPATILQSPPENEALYARAAEESHDRGLFYLVGLNFALLALAISSASIEPLSVVGGIEVVSWFALMISGIWGMRRIGSRPRAYDLFTLQARAARHFADLVAQRNGASNDTERMLIRRLEDEAVAKCDQLSSEMEKRHAADRADFGRQLTVFLAGLALLFVSRTAVYFFAG